jgi:hypothetical protein
VIFVAAREVSLFAFMLHRGRALRGDSVVRGRDARAVGYEVLLEGLSLPFVHMASPQLKAVVASVIAVAPTCLSSSSTKDDRVGAIQIATVGQRMQLRVGTDE